MTFCMMLDSHLASDNDYIMIKKQYCIYFDMIQYMTVAGGQLHRPNLSKIFFAQYTQKTVI